MKKTYRSIDELSEAIKSKLGGPFGLIIVDGKDGAGKSTVCEKLSKKLGCILIGLDDYIIPEQGGFIEHFRYEDFDRDLSEAFPESGVVIVEGILVRDILTRLDKSWSVSVYVKKVDEEGSWVDEIDYCQFESEDEAVQERISARRKWAEISCQFVDEDELSREDTSDEILRYHYRLRPEDNSDFIYERMKDA